MDLVYKIDMLRLETRVENDYFMRFANRFLAESPHVKHYERYRLLDYRHNFEIYNETGTFDDYKGSFFLGFIHNMEKPSSSLLKKYKLVLEFNPNKVLMDFGLLHQIISSFFVDVDNVRLTSCDVCTDIENVLIDSVIVDKKMKRTFIDYQRDGGRTLYLGKRGSNGQVKVYNKAKELGLENAVLTRWECHLCFQDLYFNRILAQGFQLENCLPKISFPMQDDVFEMDDDVKFRCIMHCIRTGFAKVTDFERKYAKKIRTYLDDTTLQYIDDDSLPEIRKSIISFVTDFYNDFCVSGSARIVKEEDRTEVVKKNREDLVKKCQMFLDEV